MLQKLTGISIDSLLLFLVTPTHLLREKISTPSSERITPYNTLHKPSDEKVSDLASKLVVIKLNGGLGTSMGCQGPKSCIEVCLTRSKSVLVRGIRSGLWINIC